MQFDLSQGGQGEWFTFFESVIEKDGKIKYLDPVEGAGKVCLRVADAEIIEKINTQTREKKAEWIFNPGTQEMERKTYFDQTPEQSRKEREMIWDYAIVDWKDFIDKDGNVISCTLENKMKLMRIAVFMRFVNHCIQLINESLLNAEERISKNS